MHRNHNNRHGDCFAGDKHAITDTHQLAVADADEHPVTNTHQLTLAHTYFYANQHPNTGTYQFAVAHTIADTDEHAVSDAESISNDCAHDGPGYT